jgi:hypothetical protein
MDHNTAVYGVDVSKAKLVLQHKVTPSRWQPAAIAGWLRVCPRAQCGDETTGIYHRLPRRWHVAACGVRAQSASGKHYARRLVGALGVWCAA